MRFIEHHKHHWKQSGLYSRNTNLRSTTNLYIIALAVSDLLCGTVEITLASATLIMEMGLWRRFMPISRLYRYVHLSRDASNTWFDSN